MVQHDWLTDRPGRVFTLYPLEFADVQVAFFLEFLQFNLDVRLFLLQRRRSQLQDLVLLVELRHWQTTHVTRQTTHVTAKLSSIFVYTSNTMYVCKLRLQAKLRKCEYVESSMSKHTGWRRGSAVVRWSQSTKLLYTHWAWLVLGWVTLFSRHTTSVP